MQTCKYCGALVISGLCPVCHRNSVIHPPTLMSATLFDLNPYLKKRFEWIEELRHNTGMPDLPLDPTHFTNENLPPKTLPSHMDDLPKEERKKKKIDTVEI